MSIEGGEAATSRREPAFNAPLAVTLLIALLTAAHVVRLLLGASTAPMGLTREDLAAGRVAGLITHIFVHGGWTHLLMNAAFALAFGAPVARYFGPGVRGAAIFFGYFLICGVLGALGFAAFDLLVAKLSGGPPEEWMLVGASGAASGLMGGAVRLIQGRGRLGSYLGSTVVGMSLAWIAINVVFGLTGLTPGAGGVPVAWQDHIFGYFAGLVLIGPFGRLARDHAIAP